ncbi:MAG: hypothetical protein A2826_02905 [Candidatus Doudnabacteria bacterium RIFCSPHIGHO2_01_FULL_43_23]|uniref:Uncharacterized protein n=1 Tax=Candidatus Doudnabacteria bacterium RIFCSPHIGHO2_01_FULL_43_23 TaxID=1817822 RepID=A0A1F5NSQ0_9BACT|nr:MAG: hypothetical protein A2826_02905 [Candidatus Doudnabacteria bacterium RIFCSPHIGHO2_01_FULL_43_23]
METNFRSAHSRNQLVTVLLIIGFIIFGWFLVKPTWADLKTANETLAQTQTRLDEQNAVKQSITKLISNFAAQRSKLSILDTALPDSPEVPQLLSGLEELAFTSGMIISSLQITEELPVEAVVAVDPANTVIVEKSSIVKPELVTIKIDLSLTGTTDSFYYLLSLLEHNLRLFDISAINFESNPDQSSFDLVIDTFYKK